MTSWYHTFPLSSWVELFIAVNSIKCPAGNTLWSFLPFWLLTKMDGYKDGMPHLSATTPSCLKDDACPLYINLNHQAFIITLSTCKSQVIIESWNLFRIHIKFLVELLLMCRDLCISGTLTPLKMADGKARAFVRTQRHDIYNFFGPLIHQYHNWRLNLFISVFSIMYMVLVSTYIHLMLFQ